MKINCVNCSFLVYTKEYGIICECREIKNIDDRPDIGVEFCKYFYYNRCIDCDEWEIKHGNPCPGCQFI